MSTFWSLHTHSAFSANDAMPSVPAIVGRAVELGYPALGLTDHGNVGGAVQLYKACRKAGIEPLPGEEFYITPDREHREQANYHITIAAFSEKGYRNLIGLHNLSQKNFFYKGRIDLADIALLASQGRLQGLVASSGCFFGLVTQTLVTRGPAAAERLLAALAGWFPRFYVELHNHEVTHDDGSTDLDIVLELVAIADRLGIPYLIAQDSHYVTPEQQELHNSLKTLVSFSDDPSEAQFPGGPYSMFSTEDLKGLFPPKILGRALDSLSDLADRACLRLPELEEFKLRVPDVTVSGDASTEMEQRVFHALDDMVMTLAKPERYTDRLNDELAIVKASGFADMLLLTAGVCDFMRAKDIWYQVRGSASGSLIVWLLGISQLDPVKMDLRMDRFMSADRMKPPDIDLDVEQKRRDEVIAELQRSWTVRQIGNHITYKIQPDPDDPNDDAAKGSLMRRYFYTASKYGKKLENWGQIPPDDQETLRELGKMNLHSFIGTHASGYLVTPDEAAARQVPLMWMAKPKRFVTGFNMKDIETLGFVKLDLLGLITMTAIKETCGALGWSYTDFQSIPEGDKEVFKRISAGDTAGLFQLDGYAMTRGVKELKPRNLEEVIAAMALYRPATMQSGATKDFIARRAKHAVVPERHADIMTETKMTYGVLLYQEQVIGVLRRLGMDSEELTAMLSAVKASNGYSEGAAKVLEEIKPRIRELARGRDWTEVDIDWLLGALVAYGEYSFNRAHAAMYGTTAYRQGWLAHHHPLEYWYGLVKAYEDNDRAPQMVRAARAHGIRVLRPHINFSKAGYSLDRERGAVRRGFVSVKGVGKTIAAELERHQPYASLEDLCNRVNPAKVSGVRALATGTKPEDCAGVIGILAEHSALEGLS